MIIIFLLQVNERREWAKSFQYNRKSKYEQPSPTRPETLLRGSYLSNHLTDSLVGCFKG